MKTKKAKDETADGDNDKDEDDMDTSSDESGSTSGSEAEDEDEDKKDEVFFPRSQRGVRFESPTAGRAVQPGNSFRSRNSFGIDVKRELSRNGNPYALIAKGALSALVASGISNNINADLKRHFRPFRPLYVSADLIVVVVPWLIMCSQVYSDQEGYYVTFPEPFLARRAALVLDKQPFMEYPLPVVVQEPPSASVDGPVWQDRLQHQDRPAKDPSHEDLVREARNIIVRELQEAFGNDLRTRLVAPRVTQALEKEVSAKMNGMSLTPRPTVKPEPPSGGVPSGQTQENLPGILKLPSFARKKGLDSRKARTSLRRESTPLERYESPAPRPSAMSPSLSRASVAPEDDAASVASSDVAPTQDVDLGLIAKQKKRRKSDLNESSQVKKPKLSRRVRDIDFTSSDEEEATPKDAKTKKVSPKKAKKTAQGADVEVKDEEMAFPDDTEAAATLPTPAPTDSTTSTTVSKRDFAALDSDHEVDSDVPAKKARVAPAKRKAKDKENVAGPRPRSPTPDPFEYGIAEDEEDLYYASLVIERMRAGQPLHPPPRLEELEASGPHLTGSARTEGYYPITSADKAAYLGGQNRAIVDVSQTAGSSIAVSRLNRVNTRRFVQGMEQHKKTAASDTELLKFNQLRTRKKQLKFARSPM